jgi:uncharacterized protein YjiK
VTSVVTVIQELKEFSRPSGITTFLIDGTVAAYHDCSNPEGVTVDAAGNVYVGVVSGRGAFHRSVRL